MIIERGDREIGMLPPTVIHTPFGDVELLLDRWAKDGTIFLVDPENAGVFTYDSFSTEPLAKTGDYDREELIGEFTFALRCEKGHAILGGVT